MATLPRLPRPAFAVLALALAVPGVSIAQAPPATSAPAQPPAKARWVPPIKGTAEIGHTSPVTKVVGNFVVTKMKIKNLSLGSISLLRVDEYWYDKAGNTMPGDSKLWKKPFLPGEVIEIELRVTRNPKFYQNMYKFTHANGQCKPKLLKTL